VLSLFLSVCVVSVYCATSGHHNGIQAVSLTVNKNQNKVVHHNFFHCGSFCELCVLVLVMWVGCRVLSCQLSYSTLEMQDRIGQGNTPHHT
jgi:hypothetical protein